MPIATTLPPDPLLDFQPWIGQRQCSFRFFLFDFLTRRNLRELKPYRDATPTLSHDTSRTIVRQVSNLFFNAEDTAELSTLNSRLRIQMVFPGQDPYELGIYMFIDQSRILTTAGLESECTAVDSMFIVDQEMEKSYSAGTFDPEGNVVSFTNAETAARDLLADLPVAMAAEATPFYTIGVWTAGTGRGSAIQDISVDGDYFSPWFDKDNIMRFIRVFDPATKVPTFDLDSGKRVDRNSVTLSDNLLEAPNRFIVISNGDVSGGTQLPVIGRYDVPTSAPHSIANRGFVIPKIIDWQVDYTAQANAIAANFGQRMALFETVEFTTPPDPRHDSYDVFVFNDEKWLEISWSMDLVEGGTMSHVGRRAYR
jgi:hypothetical protein